MPTVRARVYVNPKTIERVKKRLEERKEQADKGLHHRVSVGIHEADGSEEKIGYDGKPAGISLVGAAAAAEFGKGVPDRSWLRTWFDQNRSRLVQEMNRCARAEFKGDHGAIEKQGETWARELQEWIEYGDGKLQPLAEITVKKKTAHDLSSPETPLFATGQLVAAIKSMMSEV